MIRITPIYSCGLVDENTYVITDVVSGLSAVVDPDLYYIENGAEKLCKDFDISLILLTHAHFDHMYSAEELRKISGAEICIHSYDADALSDSVKNVSAQFQNKISLVPDRLLSDGDVLMLGDTEIKVLLTSGHTKGSCCYIADKAIFSGDTLFEGSVGRTDFPGGSMKEMMKSISLLKNISEDYDVYPGHGAATTLNREKKYNPFMR